MTAGVRRRTVIAGLALLGLLCAVAVVFGLATFDGRRRHEARPVADARVPMGVLGDSDSAAYHDRISHPHEDDAPGGRFHAITFQWPEVLAQLRPDQVDPGARAVWGVPRWLSVARLRDAVGQRWRGPQRDTFQFNLAWASGCEALNEGPWRQAERLADAMDEDPGRWRRGFVVIRSGVNSFGKEEGLAQMARDPDNPELVAHIDDCVRHVQRAAATLQSRHPQVRIVVVGIFDNRNWTPLVGRWRSAAEIRNIRRGLDRFDAPLKAWAAADARRAFFDDRAWFASLWGERDAQTGEGRYREVAVGPLRVRNDAGDAPEHAILGNQHAGLVWNLLWSQRLVDLVRSRFRLPIDPIRDDEIAADLERRLREVGYRP